MVKRFAITATAIMLIIIPSLSFGADRFNVPVADSPFIGPADAPLTIIEFIDFQ